MNTTAVKTIAVKTWLEQVEPTPLSTYNQLVKENLEVLTALQLKAIRTYSEMGLEQIKAAITTENAEHHELFNAKQWRVLAELAQNMLDDSARLHQVAVQFRDNLQRLHHREISNVTSV